MEKIISLLIAAIMLTSVAASAGMNAFAAGFTSYAQSISLNKTYTNWASSSDPYDSNKNYYYDAYRFTVPSSGQITVLTNFVSEVYGYDSMWYIYSANNTASHVWYGVPHAYWDSNEFQHTQYNSGNARYEAWTNVNLNAGTYYLVIYFNEYEARMGDFTSSYNFQIKQVKNGWQTINGKKYYYKNGAAVKYLQKIGGNYYYFNGYGQMCTGFIRFDGGTRYFKSNGAMAKWMNNINGYTYYFNGSGYMFRGSLLKCNNGDRYYFNNNGIMLKYRQNIHGYWFYFYGNGKMARNTYIYFSDWGGDYWCSDNGIIY